MRRSRLFTVFAGTLMAAFLLPAVALASEPHHDAHAAQRSRCTARW